MKSLTEKDLNPMLFKDNPDRAIGALDACNLLNDMYSGITMNNHRYLLGDCILAKMNLLKPAVRINPFWKQS